MNGLMNWPYALWIGLWACLGGGIGSVCLIFFMKYGGRQSFVIWSLVLCFLMAIVVVPVYGGINAAADSALGKSIWAFKGMC